MTNKYSIHKDFQVIDESYGYDSRTITLDEMVSAFNESCASGKAAWENNISDDSVDINVEYMQSFDGRSIRLWIIAPKALPGNAPCLIYYHGGAFIMAGTEMHIKLTRAYAIKAGCKVIFVDYRLAPESPFPIGFRDCYSSLIWTYNNAERLNIDRNRIAVGGDSAGGNLAAAVCNMARDKKGPKVCFQMLCYPVTDVRMNTESMRKFWDTPSWDSNYNKKMWKVYLSKGNKGMLQYVSVLQSESFKNLPNAYVEVTEFDPLRDEGIEYARALEKGGAKVELNETKGTVHAYDMIFKSEITQNNVDRRVKALVKAFT